MAVVSEQATERRSSITLALQVVELIADAKEPLSMIEITRSLGAPKSTSHRILANLVEDGVLERSDVDRTFRLGHRWSRLSRAEGGHGNLVKIFFETIESSLKDFAETMQLGVRTGPDVTFVAYVDSPRPVRLACEVGRKLPLYTAATGKVLLAFAPAGITEAVLPEALVSMTPNTITDRDLLYRDLELTRHRGYALETQESSRNLSCISAPILDADGYAIAAFTACLPINDLTNEIVTKTAPRVIDAANRIGNRMRR